MIRINALVEEKYKIVVSLFFAGFLCIGLSIFNDYGISWDEPIERYAGVLVGRYVLAGDQVLLIDHVRHYGPVFELLLFVIEIILNLTKEPRAVYFMRHLATFLLFYTSVIFFYLLCRVRFKNWKMGLLGSLFLIISPRIFAHSFYNSKDIPFMAMFIISIYTLIKYLDKKTISLAAFHALSCAILIDIRIMGVILPFFTFIFFTAELLIKTKKVALKKAIGSFFAYTFLLICFTILFWPTLWKNPFYHFIEAFREMNRYPWGNTILYWGSYIKAEDIPWHYIPVWIIISTPVLYTFCFSIGCFFSIKQLLRNPINFIVNRRNDLIFVSWFFLPLAAVIVFKSALYDAWRQVFFIYPAFLTLSLVGLTSLYESIKLKFQGFIKAINAISIFIVVFNLINVTWFMIRYHPYQNVYFNRFAGKDMNEVKNNFELDYWGLSYRQALEYILKNNKSQAIKIYVANLPGMANADILSSLDRERLVYVKNPEEAKYFLSNYRWHKEGYPYEDEYYSIKIGGAKIMVVYKLKDGG